MLEQQFSSVQIKKQVLKQLGEIADYFRRSKAGQVEWWIEQEHRRIFRDGQRPQDIPAEDISEQGRP